MSMHHKFVQLVTAVEHHPSLSSTSRLFALDEAGNVWEYGFHSEGWFELEPRRMNQDDDE